MLFYFIISDSMYTWHAINLAFIGSGAVMFITSVLQLHAQNVRYRNSAGQESSSFRNEMKDDIKDDLILVAVGAVMIILGLFVLIPALLLGIVWVIWWFVKVVRSSIKILRGKEQ